MKLKCCLKISCNDEGINSSVPLTTRECLFREWGLQFVQLNPGPLKQCKYRKQFEEPCRYYYPFDGSKCKKFFEAWNNKIWAWYTSMVRLTDPLLSKFNLKWIVYYGSRDHFDWKFLTLGPGVSTAEFIILCALF